MVSNITDQVIPEIKEWQERPLDDVYPFVFIDAVHFSVREDNHIVKKQRQRGMYIFHSEISRIGMCTFLSGFFHICHTSRNKEIIIMRKEQIITANNDQMEEKGMKSRFIHFKKRFIPALSGALMGVMLMSTTCFAAGTSAVTQPLENLKTLIIAVIGAVGVIILAKNVMEFAQAYQQQDSSTMNSALKGIVAGVMMAGISTVLTFLGF